MNNEEMKTLKPEEMEKAAGGDYADSAFSVCTWSCTVSIFMKGHVGGHYYEATKCVDCGHEYFKKDGKNISPSEFYKALYGSV